MADWRLLAQRLAVITGHIDSVRAEIIEKFLSADGQIDRRDFEFLIALRREVRSFPPELDRLLFKAIKATVLKNGFVSAGDCHWLKGLFESHGKIGSRERQFLAELRRGATNHSQEFLDWCMALGVNRQDKPARSVTLVPTPTASSPPRRRLVVRIARDSTVFKLLLTIGCFALILAILAGAGVLFYVYRPWNRHGNNETEEVMTYLSKQKLKGECKRGYDFKETEFLDIKSRNQIDAEFDGLKDGVRITKGKIKKLTFSEKTWKKIEFEYVLEPDLCYIEVEASVDKEKRFQVEKITGKLVSK